MDTIDYIHLDPKHWEKYGTYKNEVNGPREVTYRALIDQHCNKEKIVQENLKGVLKDVSLISDIDKALQSGEGLSAKSLEGFTSALRGIFDNKTQEGREASYQKLQNYIRETKTFLNEVKTSYRITPSDNAQKYLAALSPGGQLDRKLLEIVNRESRSHIASSKAAFERALNQYSGGKDAATLATAQNILRGILNSISGGAGEEFLRALIEENLETKLSEKDFQVRRTGQENTKGPNKGDVTADFFRTGQDTFSMGVQVKNWNFKDSSTGTVWTRSIGRRTTGSFGTAVKKAELRLSDVVNYLVGDFNGWSQVDEPVLNYIALKNFEEYIGEDVNAIAFRDRMFWISDYLKFEGRRIKLAPVLDTSIKSLNERYEGPGDNQEDALVRSTRVYNAFKNAQSNMY